MAYDDTNRGALFKNNKKKSEKSPDFTGKLNVDGKDYRLAGWFKKSGKGLVYTSLTVQPEESQETQETQGGGTDTGWGESGGASNDDW